MTIHILQLPASKDALPEWLEQHFVSDSLGQLVQELITVNGPEAASQKLGEVLTEGQIADVVQNGFCTLGDHQVDALLRNPQSLLTLQEHVIVTGSAYWDGKFEAGPLAKRASDISKRVREQLAESSEQSVTKASTAETPSRRKMGVLIVGFASAAALVIAMLSSAPSPSGRILGQPGLTANDTSSSSEYFNRLADAGATWTQHKPADERQLKKLLAEIIQDCEILIEADHDALSDVEREWFYEKCRLWKGKLETTLVSLEAGSATFEQALDATQQTMQKLVDVLKAGPVA